MSEAEALVYDSVELRRRIVVAFSAGELAELAQELGVAGMIRWDRGPQEAARDIVRQFEKGYGGLDTLVTKLRQKKPLVEWPEPGPPPSTSMGPMSSRMPQEAPPVAHGFGVAPPLVSPGSFGGPQPTIPAAPAFVAPAAASVMPAQAAPPQSFGARPAVAPAASASPPQPAWPGTLQPAPPVVSNGVDPRILIVVAGLMVAGGIIAYLAGRATTAPSTAPAAASSAAPTAGRRADGPATHLADSLDRSVANVARACEVRMGSAEEVFARSFEQCGPGGGTGVSPRTRTPSAPPPSTPRPGRTNPRDDQGRKADAPPREQPGAGCIKGCAAEQASCRSGCGPEPSEASRYGEYQQCFGKCITLASKCRLGCP